MAWVYLAIGLLLVLTGLLIAPYFGVYGTKQPASAESTTAEESNLEDEQSTVN
jgi:cytochrome b subunit of formate dehydrogenase